MSHNALMKTIFQIPETLEKAYCDTFPQMEKICQEQNIKVGDFICQAIKDKISHSYYVQSQNNQRVIIRNGEDLRFSRIDNLPLSRKLIIALLNGHILYTEQLEGKTAKELMAIPGFGRKCMHELEEFLMRYQITRKFINYNDNGKT